MIITVINAKKKNKLIKNNCLKENKSFLPEATSTSCCMSQETAILRNAVINAARFIKINAILFL